MKYDKAFQINLMRKSKSRNQVDYIYPHILRPQLQSGFPSLPSTH